MAIHVVKPWESVDSIADIYGIDVDNLIYVNQIPYPYSLAVGQALYISGSSPEPNTRIRTGGYAYPFEHPCGSKSRT